MSKSTPLSTTLAALRILQVDCASPYYELARNANLTTHAFGKAVREAISRGLIRGRTAVLNREALGFGITSFVRLSCQTESTNAIIELLKTEPCVLEVHVLSGKMRTIVAKVVSRSTTDLFGLVQKMSGWEGVEDCDHQVVMETFRETLKIPI